jgi:hypothetical protein
VYCFSNLQLLVRATSSKYEDTKVEWTYADAEADASSEDSDNSSISEDSGSEAEGELLLLLEGLNKCSHMLYCAPTLFAHFKSLTC